MRVFCVESKWNVPGGVWLPWSGTHWYKTYEEACKASAKLDHKQHPVATSFRVAAYEPLSGFQSSAGLKDSP